MHHVYNYNISLSSHGQKIKYNDNTTIYYYYIKYKFFYMSCIKKYI